MQQVGIADAEVINRDADTRLLQFTNTLLAESGIAHGNRFSDLQHQRAAWQLITRQGLRQDSQQITLVKLQRGEIHRYCPVTVALAVPYPELTAGLPDHPVTQRNNLTGFFGARQKQLRRQ